MLFTEEQVDEIAAAYTREIIEPVPEDITENPDYAPSIVVVPMRRPDNDAA